MIQTSAEIFQKNDKKKLIYFLAWMNPQGLVTMGASCIHRSGVINNDGRFLAVSIHAPRRPCGMCLPGYVSLHAVTV